MKFNSTYYLFCLILTIFTCKSNENQENNNEQLQYKKSDFTIAFGSCNNQNLENNFWPTLTEIDPDIWIWGGDIIYSDTEDMHYLEKNYNQQKTNVAYSNFIKNTALLGTWDDHDYGLNDGGVEYPKKKEAQQLFLDFLDVPSNSPRRSQEGIFHSQLFNSNNYQIKVIVLDTRYFRTALIPDHETSKRYKPIIDGEGTILGEQQWEWLEGQLQNSTADYHILMSSIQFLSAEHGFETWGNMPHEVDKLENLIQSSNTKNVIILSGDRHISEFSIKEVPNISYPLIDFTSSGMTHSYSNFSNEPNAYRMGQVVSQKSVGLLNFKFENNEVTFEMLGEENQILASHSQIYN